MKRFGFITLFSLCLLFTYISKGQDTLFYKATLDANGIELPLTLDVIRTKDTIFYFLGSPMQTKEKLSPSKVKYIEDSLSLGFKSAKIVLHLKESANKDSLNGTFAQMGTSSISFIRQNSSFSFKRPQTPEMPFDYNCLELDFKNPECSYNFHGTLTYPKGKEGEKYPLAVLVSGSGAQNRDSEIFGHKLFLVIADYLTKNGIAVFRYDDRGWGEKDEQMYKGTTMDFAMDAYSAIQMLKDLPMIDKKNIGICGHSEGGLIAEILLAEKKDIAWAILMAAPSINGFEILKSQGADMRDYQFDTSKVNDYWLKYFCELEPKTYLNKIRKPVLILQGGKDHQVFPQLNNPFELLPKITQKKYAKYKLYPNLNHMFQNCNTGEVHEYMNIEETIDVQVLEDIKSFCTFAR